MGHPGRGGRRRIAFASSALLDEAGRVAYVVGTGRDVTGQRAREAQVARLAAFNRQLLASVGEGILGTDLAGRVTFSNPAAARLLGREPGDLPGRAVWDLAHAPGTGVGALALPAGEGAGAAEGVTFWRPDGASFPAEVVRTPLHDEHGTLQGAVVAFRDVTARQETGAALRRANAELRRSNTELERFAYVASHDLQEPIRAVASFAGLLERKYGAGLGEQAGLYLRQVLLGASRMKGLVDDLLAFSRLSGEAPPLRPLDLDEPLAEAVLRLQARLVEAGAQLSHDPLPTVPGDGPRLAALFQNLIGNALKFRREGMPPRVHVGARPVGEGWHLTVSDNGIGIKGAYLERIFVMFQRLHTRDRYEGSGLGLSICQKIVEGHGGRIWAKSTPGVGSTFHFTLPGVPEPPGGQT